MTKLRKAELKYGNAVRAQIGNLNTPPDKSDKTEQRRVKWLKRITILMKKQRPEVSLYALMP